MWELDDEGHWSFNWTFNYTEKDWFEENTTEANLAKYWASEEIADEIYYRNDMIEFDVDWNYLVQLLKKEWFR